MTLRGTADADLLCHLLRHGAAAWADVRNVAADEVLAAAIGQRVHLLLAWQLRQPADAFDACPESTRRLFGDALRAAAAVEQVERLELRRVLDGLAQAGVRPLLFKGASLAFTHYPDPAIRPRVDTDLLVRGVEVPEAARALERLGYRSSVSITAELLNSARPAERVSGFKASSQIAFVLDDRFGLHHEVDLHWHPSIPHVFAHVLSVDALDRDAVEVPALGPGARAFGDVHALALACMHRVAHHHGTEHLLWLYDIHLLAQRMSAADADALVDLAAAARISGVCLAGLSAAAGCLATRVPPGCVERLEEDRARDPDPPSAAYLRHTLSKADVLRADMAALGGWRARAAYIRDLVFPPRGYITKTYGVRTPALLPLLYARRAITGAVKWFSPDRRR